MRGSATRDALRQHFADLRSNQLVETWARRNRTAMLAIAGLARAFHDWPATPQLPRHLVQVLVALHKTAGAGPARLGRMLSIQKSHASEYIRALSHYGMVEPRAPYSHEPIRLTRAGHEISSAAIIEEAEARRQSVAA